MKDVFNLEIQIGVDTFDEKFSNPKVNEENYEYTFGFIQEVSSLQDVQYLLDDFAESCVSYLGCLKNIILYKFAYIDDKKVCSSCEIRDFSDYLKSGKNLL